jgi:hypothetical protein
MEDHQVMSKTIYRLATVAAALAVALAVLIASPASEVQADPDAVLASASTLNKSGTATITIDGDEADGPFTVLTTAGTTALITGWDVFASSGGGSNNMVIQDGDAALAADNVIINGQFDADDDGTTLLDAGDDCTSCYGGYNIIDGQVDADADGVGATDAGDDLTAAVGPLGFAVINGNIDVDADAAGPTDADDDSVLDSKLDAFQIQYTAPATAPSTATVTFIQDIGVKTLTFTVRGSVKTVDVYARTTAATSTANKGVEITYIQEVNNTTWGDASANINTVANDSDGVALVAQTFVFITTDGTLSATSVVAGAAQKWATSALSDDSTTDDGESVTVTVSVGGKTNTVSVSFAGAPTTCSITDTAGTAGPFSVGSGDVLALQATWNDASGGPAADRYALVADTDIVAIAAASSNTVKIFAAGKSNDGVTTFSVAVTGVGATTLIGTKGTASCSATIVAGAATTAAAAAPSSSGYTPTAAGQSGLGIYSDIASAADFFGLVCGSSDTGASVTITTSSGATVINVSGAPALANNAFTSAVTFPLASTAAFVSCP